MSTSLRSPTKAKHSLKETGVEGQSLKFILISIFPLVPPLFPSRSPRNLLEPYGPSLSAYVSAKRARRAVLGAPIRRDVLARAASLLDLVVLVWLVVSPLLP